MALVASAMPLELGALPVKNTFIHFGGETARMAKGRLLRRVRTDPSPPNRAANLAAVTRRIPAPAMPFCELDEEETPSFPLPPCEADEISIVTPVQSPRGSQPTTPARGEPWAPKQCRSAAGDFGTWGSEGFSNVSSTSSMTFPFATPAAPVGPVPRCLDLGLDLSQPDLGVVPFWTPQPPMQWTPEMQSAPSHCTPVQSPQFDIVPDGLSFTCTLRMMDGTGLGLEVIVDSEDALLVTQVLDNGGIQAWNRQCVDGKEWKAVRPGDKITEVNRSTSAIAMLQECRQKSLLVLRVERPDEVTLPIDANLEVERLVSQTQASN